VGDEIVLDAAPDERTRYGWVFSEITDDAFTWRGYTARDGGSWVHDELMFAHRIR
jgi:hypothetical protein